MRCVKTGVSLIFLLLLAAQVVTANVIVVEGDGNPSYLTFVGDAPQGISAFGVEIRYPNGTHVTGVESVEPFEVVSGIDVVNGTVKIGGYTSQCSQAAVNDRLQLAEVWLTDTVEGVVIVDYLEDSQRNPIQVSNQVSASSTPIETPVPTYVPPPTYSSPGTAQASPAPAGSITVPETVTQVSPAPQASVSGTPSATDTVRDGVEAQTVPSASSDTVSQTGQSEIDAGESTVSPTTKAPIMFCTPFGAIFFALLLIRRGRLTNR